LQALIDAIAKGEILNANIAAVLSSRSDAYALERASSVGIATLVEKPDFTLKKPERRIEHSNRILKHCREYAIDLIINAGFLSVLSGAIIDDYKGRIINIHPALLPKYGGQGMYGEHVHKAVLEAGAKESGCTVHYVEAGIDSGPVILQRRVPVYESDTVASLAERILKEEHIAIVEAVRLIISEE